MISYLIFISLFLASSLAVVISKPLSVILKNLYFKNPTSIPSFNPEIVLAKSFDFTNFILFVFFGLLLFFINYFVSRRFVKKEMKDSLRLNNILFLLFSFLIFLQTHFVTHSGKTVLALILLGQLIYISSLRLLINSSRIRLETMTVLNGVLSGFYFLLLANQITNVVSIPLLFIFSAPILYILSNSFKVTIKYTRSPFHLFLFFSAFISGDLQKLILLGMAVLIVITIFRDNIIQKIKIEKYFTKIVYPIVILILVTYNPIFYLGNFDSIEEGYLLGWLQRLINGQVLYRDVAVFHPPIIIWLLYLFTKFTDFSVYYFRLFLVILQVIAIIIIYFTANRVLQRLGNKIIIVMLLLGFSNTLVKNNVEFRVAIGLLPILIWSFYSKRKNNKLILISGIFSAIALFTSLEVGISAIITLFIVNIIFCNEKVKCLGQLILGIIVGATPFLAIFIYQGALVSFVEQLFFYATSFSNGYFNMPVERAISLSFLYWHIIDQYFSSVAWMWELAQMSLVAGLMIVAVRVFNMTRDFRDILACSLSIYGLLLFRSALGRSDWYHLVFVLLVSTIVLFYLVEKLTTKKVYLNYLIILVITLVFGRLWFSEGFIDKQLYRFQTYAKVVGPTNSYNFSRAGEILVGKEVNTENINKIVELVQVNVSPTETIFTYPWMPELYFFSNRKNPTSFDTPYSFFNFKYQQQAISQLKLNRPKLLIYNPEMNFGGFTTNSLPFLEEYILQNFKIVNEIGPYQIRK